MKLARFVVVLSDMIVVNVVELERQNKKKEMTMKSNKRPSKKPKPNKPLMIDGWETTITLKTLTFTYGQEREVDEVKQWRGTVFDLAFEVQDLPAQVQKDLMKFVEQQLRLQLPVRHKK